MIKKIIYAAAASLLLVACGGEKKEQEKPKEKAETLKEADIYNFQVVEGYTQNVHDTIMTDAKKLFLNAIDIYRNKKDAAGSIAEFKKSLVKYPTAKTYYELGNALIDAQNYKEAIESFHMAEKMDYNPLSKVLYNLACAYSLNENGEQALKYVQLAIENGYNNAGHLLTDADLEFARKDPEFMDVYQTAMSGALDPETALFDLFEVSFAQAVLPMSMGPEQTQKVQFTNSIAYDFESFVAEMVNPNFSRDVGDEFFYLAKVAENENYIALIYGGAQMMYERPPVYHILATYTSRGKLIDKIEIGGYHYYEEPMKGYKIDDKLNIEVNEYELVFEKNVDEYGYDDNRVIENQLLNTKKFKITDGGKIKSADGNVAWVDWRIR
ncbi:MAG: tetratricopeptide repeat protein [Bacteroidota bacterium]